jgi:DNA polymerase-3 subunit delta'
MGWAGLEGHDSIVERFRRSLQRNRLASSYLFVGPPGVGKRTFALRLAQALLCERHGEAEMDPCQECPSCQQVIAQTHPDVEFVSLPIGKTNLLIEQFVGDREHRSQEGFCHRMSLRPASGRRRIGIIDDADCFNDASANCLLKMLEEPPPRSVLILIGTSLQRQLPTIRSRCQVIHFQGHSDEFIKLHLLERGMCERAEEAAQIARLAEGSLDRAYELADPELRQFCEGMTAHWNKPLPDTLMIARDVKSFVDAAGKEAAERRARLRQIVRWMIGQLRQELAELIARAAPAPAAGSRMLLDVVSRRIDRSLEALQQIDANANLATLIECWVDDMGQTQWRSLRIQPAEASR